MMYSPTNLFRMIHKVPRKMSMVMPISKAVLFYVDHNGYFPRYIPKLVAGAYSEPSLTTKTELFAKIING